MTVERFSAKKPMAHDEWQTWVDSMAGTWQGEFERPPRGEYEEQERVDQPSARIICRRLAIIGKSKTIDDCCLASQPIL